MAAPARARSVAAVAVLTAVLVSPAPAAAIADEESHILPGPSWGAMVGDVDGDGQRELVQLVPWRDNPSQLAVDVVSVGSRGLSSHGQALIHRATQPDDTTANENPRGADLLPLNVNEPARLLAWHDGDTERLLVASMQGSNRSPAIERACCLTLSWLTLDDRGATRLELIQNTAYSAAWILAVDLDGDGTDELAGVETPDPALPDDGRVIVLRWNGTDFDRHRRVVPGGPFGGVLTDLGDSDGRPGHEIGYELALSPDGGGARSLRRISLAGGEIEVETSGLPTNGTLVSVPGPDGALLTLVGRGELETLSWPARGESVLAAGGAPGGEALGVVGEGDAARLLVLRTGNIQPFDWRLQPGAAVLLGHRPWFVAGARQPYVGELPGGDERGLPAFVHGGRLISAPRGDGEAVVREIATLPGKVPVGLFGPDRAWAAVADADAFPTGRRGGPLGVSAGQRATEVAVLPAAELFQLEADGGRVLPQLEGGFIDEPERIRPILHTAGHVVARFAAPPGSRVRVTGEGDPGESVVGPDGMAEVILVESDPGASNDETRTVRLLVVTPGGHGYASTWEVRIRRRAPALSATTPMAPLTFDVPLSGRTEAGATVLVDGEPVPVTADGSFSADVAAGPLPRDVRVEATDRVGNSRQLTISVVGPLDYRRLPWVPIVAGLTLLAGAILYLRSPRPSAVAAQHPDDGVLEEIQ